MNKELILLKRRQRYRSKHPLENFSSKEINVNQIKVDWKYAEAICNAKLIELGYETFLPFISNGEIDIIACKDNKIYRIQIKAFSPINKNVIYVDLTRNKPNERKLYSNIDWFLIYDGTNIYKVESSENLHSVNLRYTTPKNDQGNRIKMASDYILK